MEPYYQTDRFTLYQGDCRIVMRDLSDCSVDSVVCDPPYELGFMGKGWDRSGIAYDVAVWSECLRVLKPGGHLLAFGGSRTYHRLACAVEDAGFEIRDDIDFWYDANPIFAEFYNSLSSEQQDMLHASVGASHLSWVYGSGFPKSLDVSKAIDAAASRTSEAVGQLKDELRRVFGLSGLTLSVLNARCGFEASGYLRKSSTWTSVLPSPDKWWKMREVIGCDDSLSFEFKETEREVVGLNPWTNSANHFVPGEDHTKRVQLDMTAPTTDAAKQWNGWGTALKPAHEPIVLARKPLIGTVAENVLQHGTGGLNIDGCRIEGEAWQRVDRSVSSGLGDAAFVSQTTYEKRVDQLRENNLGRWPANVIHDGSDEVLALFPEAPGQQGDLNGHSKDRLSKGIFGDMKAARDCEARLDSGSAARFFYCAKATQGDRNEGLEDLPLRSAGDVTDRKDGSAGLNSPRAGAGRNNGSRNPHPTVKPTDLMRYLSRLVTPPNGVVLDPFCGSGSTGKAAMLEGLKFIGIELNEEYCQLAQRRIEAVTKQGLLFASA